MNRHICIDLHRGLVWLHPDWHHDDDDKGTIRVVMTGYASDPLDGTLRENVQCAPAGAGQAHPAPPQHGYLPDKQEEATLTVLEQAKVRSEG